MALPPMNLIGSFTILSYPVSSRREPLQRTQQHQHNKLNIPLKRRQTDLRPENSLPTAKQRKMLLQSSQPKLHLQLQNPPSLPPPRTFNLPKFSRRELALCTNLLLLGCSQPAKSLAAEETNSNPTPACFDKGPTQRAFLDVSIDGKPAGRIVIGLYGEDVPVGATRFSRLVSGAAGITYRRKEFVKIVPNYVQHGGVRSYGVDADIASKAGGNLTNESLTDEWERANDKCTGTRSLAGMVGIIVRNPSKPPPNMKLVARKGKLEIEEEEVVKDPNGTEFVIMIRDSPELDSSVLVVGRVLEGMEAVQRIGQVKTVQENTTSPYFKVAKLIGDKRAVVAERGFNRPYLKVLVTNCGLLD